MIKKNNVSKSLQEVWELKDMAYEEVKDLDIKSAIRKRLDDSRNTTLELGYKLHAFSHKIVIKS